MATTIHKIGITICILLLSANMATAQVQPTIENYKTENGLPHNTIYGALRDNEGFLWLCTWHGLTVYDGYTFRPFIKRAAGRGDIPPHKVSTLVDDGKGHLWMRNIDNGFYMFDKKSEVFTDLYPYLKPLARNMLVRKIKDIGEGKVLFITRDKNLYIAFADNNGKPIIQKLYDAHKDIDPTTFNLKRNIQGEKDGYLFWIGTDSNIDAVRRGAKNYSSVVAAHSPKRVADEWESLIPEESDSIMSEVKHCDAGQHGVFILSRAGHLYHYDRNSHTMTDLDNSGYAALEAGKQIFYDIHADYDGNIWLTSGKNGLYKISFPTGKFSMLYPNLFPPQKYVDNDNTGIRALFRTKDGMLMVGSRGESLKVIDPTTGTVVHTFDEDIQNVYHIMQDSNGNIWISSKGNGLIKATQTGNSNTLYTCEYFRHEPDNPYSISSDRVYYTKQDHNGRIWVCTYGGGINLIEVVKGTTIFHHYANTFVNYPHGDLYINVRAIEEDSKNNLWASTTNGMIYIHTSDDNDLSKTVFETSNRISDDIYSMYRDSKGDIWLGIFGGGLNKIIGYDEENHSPILQQYGDHGKWRYNTINAITEDRQGDLWICTDNELASLDMHTGVINAYDHQVGFPAVHIEDNTVTMTPEGGILLGCKEGLLMFSPEQLKRSTGKKYNTFIVNMRVMNHCLQYFKPSICDKSIFYADTIVLKHDQNMFSLEFATLKFYNHSQLSYTYLLEGHEDHWHISNNSNVASYSSVAPGTYTFRVRAIGDDFPERRLTIIVRPPWWATWWAYTIYLILFLAAAYGVFRLVTYIIKMRNEIYIHKRMDTIKKQVLQQRTVEEEHEFVSKVKKLVEDNIALDLSVDAMAEEMGLSRSAFFKRIKSLTGKAPIDFVKDIRLNTAAHLIATTSMGITEIAYQVGFNDPGYFGKCFRKKFNMTPKEYRNKQ